MIKGEASSVPTSGMRHHRLECQVFDSERRAKLLYPEDKGDFPRVGGPQVTSAEGQELIR